MPSQYFRLSSLFSVMIATSSEQDAVSASGSPIRQRGIIHCPELECVAATKTVAVQE